MSIFDTIDWENIENIKGLPFRMVACETCPSRDPDIDYLNAKTKLHRCHATQKHICADHIIINNLQKAEGVLS